jgi:hypothetical protein
LSDLTGRARASGRAVPRADAEGFFARTWAGFVPNGIGEVKPNHYGDMLRVAWHNRDALPYAGRILKDGTCDGCALVRKFPN